MTQDNVTMHLHDAADRIREAMLSAKNATRATSAPAPGLSAIWDMLSDSLEAVTEQINAQQEHAK